MYFKKKVYLDAAANTPICEEVLGAMRPYLSSGFVGNSFASHSHGVDAAMAIEEARGQVASFLHVKSSEVYFTSGATEGSNWVIKGLALNELANREIGFPWKNHIVCSSMEHASVLNTCAELEKIGFVVTYIRPNASGQFVLSSFKNAVNSNTLLVCCMAVNNETGAIFANVDQIGSIVKKNKSLMLCDITQLVSYGDGVANLTSKFPHIDYFTFSGHKIYGPTGVGCLIARKDVPLYPFITGGSQESGKRGGTCNTAGIVGIGKACEIMSHEKLNKRYYTLYHYLFDQLTDQSLRCSDNLSGVTPRQFNIVSLNCSRSIDCEACGFDTLAEALNFYNISVSAGSACDADHIGVYNPSHVLVSLGLSEKAIRNTIRVSFSKYTTKSDIRQLVKILTKLAKNK